MPLFICGILQKYYDLSDRFIRETNKIVRVIVMKTVIGFMVFCINAGIQVVNVSC